MGNSLRKLLLRPDDKLLRIYLIFFSIALQSTLELPRQDVIRVLPFFNILIPFITGTSILSIFLAACNHIPQIVAQIMKVAGPIAFCGCLALGVLGIGQYIKFGESFTEPPSYHNDGTTLDHNAAILLTQGQNPYVTSDIVAAIRRFGIPADLTTPLQQGAFAHDIAQPAPSQLKAIMATEPAGQPQKVLEFESHLSYPALSFLTLLPAVWLHLPNVLPIYAVILTIFLVMALFYTEKRWWPVIILTFFADIPVINSTLTADLDLLNILFLFIAWLTFDKKITSSVFWGLAAATKQIAWFFAPFYFMLSLRQEGLKKALQRASISSAVFFLINGPFMVNNFKAWLDGNLAPIADKMFPLGTGFIHFAVINLLPMWPEKVYTGLELVGFVVALLAYWKLMKSHPESVFILAVFPLFFAWRSLSTYFYFSAIPILIFIVQSKMKTGKAVKNKELENSKVTVTELTVCS